MAKLVLTHNVADVEKWLSFKAERAESIGKLGGSNVQDYVSAEGSNAVAVTCEIDDVETALTTVGSPPPDLAEVMGRHGVLPPLSAYIER